MTAAGDAGPSILPLRLEAVTYEAGGRRLVDHVSAELRAGARTIVIGPNGAGKSLLMRLCHGLIRPTSGAVRWGNGQELPEALRRRQALVFQRPVLLRRSALANITYALSLAGCPRRLRQARAEDALDRFGLLDLARRPARVLSGGEQQRLALARAWATGPEVLFLDEPTAALDPAATRAVEAAVAAFHAAGVKVIMATHDLGQARRLADEVMFLCRGRLLEHTPAEIFFRAPQSAEARAFLRGELDW
ncbi:MAG: ATP-binding cassette domain-containing protein [Pseudomonadota bacterium]|nr:ATP-binding cassette domain-containing protein [Pseudomonadota bacterium]